MKDDIIATHRIPLIFKFCRKEFSSSYPCREHMIAFPEVEIEDVFIANPLQPPSGESVSTPLNS